MASAAALYALQPSSPRDIEAVAPLAKIRARKSAPRSATSAGWTDALKGQCRLKLPDSRLQFLYDAALRTVILHAPGTTYAGPYTYKRFWFRDAAFIVHALLAGGLFDRAEAIIDGFFPKQTAFGYFESQNGEWDSNGQTLWIMRRFVEMSGRSPKREWRGPVMRAARWIERKRVSDSVGALHAGLMPPGFSAEHLGPNDYYLWDDFWSVSGLRAAAFFARLFDDARGADEFDQSADSMEQAIRRCCAEVEQRIGRPALPASPYRRLDSAAVGSLVVGYPLHLWDPHDRNLLDTAEYLYEKCLVHGAFFHDMTHSGINPYLTLHIAQVLMRAGDRRAASLISALADLASPTGQWPEAIHPNTLGGCMGDGQHTWAAAEWLMVMRNSFVREESKTNTLVIGAGLIRDWLNDSEPVSFGPAPTSFGPVTVQFTRNAARLNVEWEAQWHAEPPHILIQPPWLERPVSPASHEQHVSLDLES